MKLGQFKVVAAIKGQCTHPGSPAIWITQSWGPGWASCGRGGVLQRGESSAQAEALYCQAKSIRTGGMQIGG